ncbi:MAG: RNA polymerase-binding protein DksA [Gammaproteobacteria bacterium CG22_combo_CG10-13_8_21_14_all_40_8]|nr:MAG: RNA polymerase-binding protein DksA [Gammaproteobacteria bacterium CG22_combo_CG10-13_8_21_14_all_40_8]
MPAKKKPTTTLSMLGIEPYKEKKGEEYMNEKQLAHFSAVLEAWKAQLMLEVDTTINNMKDATHYADPADRASQEEEFNLELRTRDRERKLLRKIDKTLKKIEAEDYGFCESCEEEIGIRRLEARPTAEQCIDCKTLAEIKEKHFGT